MKKITKELPCGNALTREIYGHEAFTGIMASGFFVHPDSADRCRPERVRWYGGWNVTHMQTGFSVEKGLRTKKSAISLAKKLADIGCWDFDSVDGVKSIPADQLARIRSLCAQARAEAA